jgi:hypothetical protein
MRLELSKALSPGGIGSAFDALLRLSLIATVAVSECSALAAGVGDPKVAQEQPSHGSHESGQPEENH